MIDPKLTLFSRENALVAIYTLFSDNKCPLFARLGGGVAERGQCHLFYRFFYIRAPLSTISLLIFSEYFEMWLYLPPCSMRARSMKRLDSSTCEMFTLWRKNWENKTMREVIPKKCLSGSYDSDKIKISSPRIQDSWHTTLVCDGQNDGN